MTENELAQLALAIGKNVVLTQKEVLTLEEAAQYTGMKKSYLYKLTASKAIPHYMEKPRLIDPGKQARLTPESKISLTPFE